MSTKGLKMTTHRRKKGFCDGIFAGLSAPSNLLLGELEKPFRYRKFTVDDAWQEVGRYLQEATRTYEKQVLTSHDE